MRQTGATSRTRRPHGRDHHPDRAHLHPEGARTTEGSIAAEPIVTSYITHVPSPCGAGDPSKVSGIGAEIEHRSEALRGVRREEPPDQPKSTTTTSEPLKAIWATIALPNRPLRPASAPTVMPTRNVAAAANHEYPPSR